MSRNHGVPGAAWAYAHLHRSARSTRRLTLVRRLQEVVVATTREEEVNDNPRFIRPEGCICPQFADIGEARIADLTCPVHGTEGTDPGDGFWEVKTDD